MVLAFVTSVGLLHYSRVLLHTVYTFGKYLLIKPSSNYLNFSVSSFSVEAKTEAEIKQSSLLFSLVRKKPGA